MLFNFFDIGCLASVIGIWPRFIEPKLLSTSKLSLPLHPQLKGLRVLHFTDLHFNRGVSTRFLERLSKRMMALGPDLILFTGDFLCYSRLESKERLLAFLNSLSAPLGCFCTFGNHDYASYVSRDPKGDYVVQRPLHPLKGIVRGMRTLLFKELGKGEITREARRVPMHGPLCELLEKSPFVLLENRTITLPIGLNLTGLGDYGLGRCLPAKAFEDYDPKLPGIVLSHNPDTFPELLNYPGNWILAGHTHGEQIHLPFLRSLSRKLARLEDPRYTRGLFPVGGKTLYVNRGIGSYKPFRLFSPPEILLIEVGDD